MRLSIKQKAALLRLYQWPWKAPWRDARTNHQRGVLKQGWARTMWSLEHRKLVRYVRSGEEGRHGIVVDVGGYELTDEGLTKAEQLSIENDPKILKEATR